MPNIQASITNLILRFEAWGLYFNPLEKLILIDGSGLIYRGFYAIPPFLKSPDGKLTNAVFGFTNILLSLLAHQKPEYLTVAFDKKGPTFRHKEFVEYKATRVKAPQELYDQIPLVKSVLQAFAVPFFEIDSFEADDIIATIVKKLTGNKALEILIATGDFDVFQCVAPRVSILYPAKGFKDADVLQTKDIQSKFGIKPSQIPDFKGLAGDSSDNIPGVKGIGEKGARELLKKYSTLDNIYRHLDKIPPVLQRKLITGKESAFLSKKLATLIDDVPLTFDLKICKVTEFNNKLVSDAFFKLGFKSLQKRVDEMYGRNEIQGSLFAG